MLEKYSFGSKQSSLESKDGDNAAALKGGSRP